MTDQPTYQTQEPYPFSTILSLIPGGRHELLTAVVAQSDPPKCNGGGYRYSCLFPVPGGVRVAKVYSEEIAAATGLDLDGDILCSECLDKTQKRCKAWGITPATCA